MADRVADHLLGRKKVDVRDLELIEDLQLIGRSRKHHIDLFLFPQLYGAFL